MQDNHIIRVSQAQVSIMTENSEGEEAQEEPSRNERKMRNKGRARVKKHQEDRHLEAKLQI